VLAERFASSLYSQQLSSVSANAQECYRLFMLVLCCCCTSYWKQNSVLNLRTVFDSVDTSGSGYIDAQQWRAAVGHIAGTLQNGQQVLLTAQYTYTRHCANGNTALLLILPHLYTSSFRVTTAKHEIAVLLRGAFPVHNCFVALLQALA
jgi:hypothetical protein